MRETVGFLVVVAVVVFVVWSGWAIFKQHKDRYEGQACGGAADVKCPAGYACEVKGQAQEFGSGAAGQCRFLIKF